MNRPVCSAFGPTVAARQFRLRSTGRGFTLIELLVVVAIIGLLISMLVPALDKAMEAAEDASCRSNLRNVGMGFRTFGLDNQGVFPAGPGSNGPNPPKGDCWMGKETWPGASRVGSILAYVSGTDTGENHAKKLYRCPSLAPGVVGSGNGSNGMFDYVSYEIFSGAKITKIPATGQVHDRLDNADESVSISTPIVTEESPNFHLNRGNIDPGHDNIDQMATNHAGRGNFMAVDGGVDSFRAQRNDLGPQPLDFSVRAPSGKSVHLSACCGPNAPGARWGVWNGL